MHQPRPYSRRALVIPGVASLLYLFLAVAVGRGWTLAMDIAALRWFEGRGSPRLNGIALDATAFGSAYAIAAIALALTFVLVAAGHRVSALQLWVAIAGGWLISSTLKGISGRSRPEVFEWVAPYAGQTSFPSGHSLNAMVFFSTLGYLLLRIGPPRLTVWQIVPVLSALILLVGVSRVYLGVHYPSDAAGGFLAGLAWAAVCAWGATWLQGRRAA